MHPAPCRPRRFVPESAIDARRFGGATMNLALYVATGYANAGQALEVHATTELMGARPVSSWAKGASGAEDLEHLPRAARRALARKNDRDLLSAHLVLALAKEGIGGEM